MRSSCGARDQEIRARQRPLGRAESRAVRRALSPGHLTDPPACLSRKAPSSWHSSRFSPARSMNRSPLMSSPTCRSRGPPPRPIEAEARGLPRRPVARPAPGHRPLRRLADRLGCRFVGRAARSRRLGRSDLRGARDARRAHRPRRRAGSASRSSPPARPAPSSPATFTTSSTRARRSRSVRTSTRPRSRR